MPLSAFIIPQIRYLKKFCDFQLMDTDRGRKKVGGKIEIILKIREPLVDKDVDVVNEKWLVLDSHLRTLQV